MSFLNALYNSYVYSTDNGLVDDHSSSNTVLLPIYHTSLKSNGKNIIQLSLRKDGSLFKAEMMGEDEVIVFPVTEDSVARSGKNPASHPLVDKLSYIVSGPGDKHQRYLTEFNSWFDRMSDGPEKIFLNTIYQFLTSHNVLDQIVDSLYGMYDYQLEGFTASYTMLEKNKSKQVKIDLGDVFVTFVILEFEGPRNISVTNNVPLHQAYIQYIDNTESDKGICNISGKLEKITAKHRGLMGNAKLISVSNNTETYRGRFRQGADIIQVGYKTSEKIHLMLKYLLENPNSHKWLGEQEYLINWFSTDVSNDSQIDLLKSNPLLFGNADTEDATKPVTIQNKEVGDSLLRGEIRFDADSQYYVGIIDKASNGRISVKYFREMPSSQIIENLKKWQQQYHWYRFDAEKGQPKQQTPSLYSILTATYGIERDGKLVITNDNFKKDQFTKFVTYVIDGGELPHYIIKQLAANIQNRLRYDETWDSLLFVALAILSHQREEKYTDMLNREKVDRSYLFGRLLAVYEQIESATFAKANKIAGEPTSERLTNAQHFWSAFNRNPATTTQILEEKVKPYEKKLRTSMPGLLIKLEKEKSEIVNKLHDHFYDNANFNNSLEYDFIFGYQAERKFLFTKHPEEEKVNVE